MQQITIKVKSPKDFYLLKEIAEKLGITIIVEDQEIESITETRNWEFIGSVDLKGQLDNINIRDVVHE